MPNMLVTLDTSHLEMSPLNLLGFALKNNQVMSVTAATCQDPIGPCGPLEQSVDRCRQELMAACSSALDFGAHPPVVRYSRVYTVGVAVRVRTIIRVMCSIKSWVRIGVSSVQGWGSV